MTLHSRLERRILLASRENRDLPAPAVSENRPRLELAPRAAARRETIRLTDYPGDLRQRRGRRGLCVEEIPQLLFVLVGLRREPGDVCGLAFEEIGDEDAVFLRGGGGEDVGALQGLREEAKDVWFLLLVWGSVFCVVEGEFLFCLVWGLMEGERGGRRYIP
jgi:hypothetical protein